MLTHHNCVAFSVQACLCDYWMNVLYKYFILAHFPPCFIKKGKKRKKHTNKYPSGINKAWTEVKGL